MATPQNDHYACPSGGVIAGGRYSHSLALSFVDGVSSSYSLAQVFPDINGSATIVTVTSGTLPTGVTLDSLGKRVYYDGTPGVGDISVQLTSEPTAPSLTVGGSGVLPVMAGIVFPKGKIFGVVGTESADLYVNVLRTWNDGSVKHAVVTGTANGGDRVTFNQVSKTNTLLTHSNILALNPSAFVNLGAIGSASLQSLLTIGPTTTWLSTPGMVECHYRTSLATANIFVEFRVRLFSNGACFVRILVENTHRLTNSGVNQSLTGTVIIDNVTVHTYSATSLYKNTLHVHERWIGTTQYTHLVKNDTKQIQRTKLVPNYGMTTYVSEASLASLPQNYAIGSRLLYTALMGDTGYQEQIGLLPNWEAKYLVSNDDRALRSVFAHGKAIFNYPLVWREGSRMLLPTDYPTSNMYGVAQGGSYDASAGSLTYEKAHAPSVGYLAYLVSGDPLYLDAMLGQAALLFQLGSTGQGSGTNRRFFTEQPRSTAWSKRTIGQAASLTPDSHVGKPIIQEWVAKNMSFFKSVSIDDPNATNSQLGYPTVVSTYNESLGQSVAPWMHNFWIGTMGYLSDIEATDTANMVNLNSLRDWMYRGIVGLLGDADGFWYTYASSYSLIISSEVVPNYTYRTASSLFMSWSEVWEANYSGYPKNNTIGATSTAPTNYWGNLLPAISYAVDHLALGAAEAWGRLTGATNWSQFLGAEFYVDPVWACAPRGQLQTSYKNTLISFTQVTSDLPAWRAAMGNLTIINVSSNSLVSLNPNDNPLINPNYPDTAEWYGSSGIAGLVDPWNGACWDEETLSFWLPIQGGHQDYGGNEPYQLDLSVNNPKWVLRRYPSGAIGNILTTNDGPAQEATGKYADGRPRSTHSANKFASVPGVGIVLGSLGSSWYSGQISSPTTWLLDKNTADWTLKAIHPATGQGGSGGVCYDSLRHRVWFKPDAEGYTSWLDLNSWTWTVMTAFPYDPSWNIKQLHYLKEYDLIFQIDAAKSGMFCLWDPNTGTHYTPGYNGTPPPGLNPVMGGYWDGNRMLFWNNLTNTQVIGVLSPRGNPRTSPWLWSSIPFTGVVPTDRVPNGTYSRFAYSKKLRGCVLQNGVTAKTQFFSIDSRPVLGAIGHSKVVYEIFPSTTSASMYGYAHHKWMNAFLRKPFDYVICRDQLDATPPAITNDRTNVNGFLGQGGAGASNVAAMMPDYLETMKPLVGGRPCVIAINAESNSLYSGASATGVWASYQTMIDQFKALGWEVIVNEPTPSDRYDTVANNASAVAFRDICIAKEQDGTVLKNLPWMYDTFHDPNQANGYLYPLPGYTLDGAHLNTVGAMKCGLVAADAMAGIYPPWTPLASDVVCSRNPTLTGTGGTKGDNASGVVPDYYTLSGYGTYRTLVGAQTANGFELTCDFTGNFAADGYIWELTAWDYLSNVTPGVTWHEVLCDVEILEIENFGIQVVGGTGVIGAASPDMDTDSLVPWDQWLVGRRMVLHSEPFVAPAGMTKSIASFRMKPFSTPCHLKVRIYWLGMKQV